MASLMEPAKSFFHPTSKQQTKQSERKVTSLSLLLPCQDFSSPQQPCQWERGSALLGTCWVVTRAGTITDHPLRCPVQPGLLS